MKTKTLGWIVVLAVTGCSFASCSQAKVECQVLQAGAPFSYAARYVLKSTPSPACMPLVQKGDLIGMESYHPASADGLTYDASKTTLAIKADSVGNELGLYGGVGAADPCLGTTQCKAAGDCTGGAVCTTGFCVDKTCTTVHQPYGGGSFTASSPDAKDFCATPTLSASEVDFPDTVDTAGAVLVGCKTDADCPATPKGAVCDPTKTCSATCASDSDCQVLAKPGDPTSGSAASGAVCDTTTMKCKAGCRGKGAGMATANSCVTPFACTSADSTVGSCKLTQDNVTYQWSNIQIYVTAAAQGTQWTGDLTYKEKLTALDGTTADCSIDYKVIAVGPGIACTKVDDKGANVLDMNGKQQPDANLCSPCTDPDAGRTIASGINPNFPTACVQLLGDPDAYGRPAFYCMLKDTSASAVIPQLGDAPVCPSDANLN